MNFSYGIIGIVGVLAAISIGFIAMDPTDIIEPRVVLEENLVACTMQWDPMCGVDGETYGNMCMLDAADIKLDYQGECVVAEPEVMEEVMEPEVMESESTSVEFDGVGGDCFKCRPCIACVQLATQCPCLPAGHVRGVWRGSVCVWHMKVHDV